MPADYDEVLHNVTERDRIDRTRAVSPLRRADDAHLLANDNITREQQMEILMEIYRKTVGQKA